MTTDSTPAYASLTHSPEAPARRAYEAVERRGWPARLAVAACATYVVGVLAALALLHLAADRWWVGTVLSYGPRWPLVALAPLVAIVAWAARERRWAVAACVAGLVAAGGYINPAMALSVESGARGQKLSVAAFNIRQQRLGERFVETVVEELNADVTLLVECRSGSDERGRYELYGRHVLIEYGLCLFSKYPIVSSSRRDPTDAWERGGSAAILRAVLDVEGRPVNVVAVHLATVRSGLEAILHERLEGIDDLEDNTELRDWESRVARDWVDESSGPVIVVGDLNLPVESAIYGAYWSDLDNAYDECGWGMGDTKHTRWFGARMDHILMSDAFSCESAAVGDSRGSDHSPVTATLVLNESSR